MTIQAGQCYYGDTLVLANVASGVAAGDELGPSTTDGQLAAGSDGYSALTDEGGVGGLLNKETPGAGLAAVRVHGSVTYEVGETVSPGDAVGIDSGQLRAANSNDGTVNVIGVVGRGGGESAGEDYESGDNAPVHLLE
jgi:hypothetical protein